MKYLYLFVFICSAFSISAQSPTKHLNQGNIVQKKYLDTIPIEFVRDKIFLKVELAGKIRRFLLDTGAPTVVSKKLAEELNLPILGRDLMRDANENSDTTTFVQVPMMKIGKIEFQKTTAVIVDFEQAPVFACLDIEGFIGSNQLRNSVVYLDIQKKQLILSNEMKSLKLPKNYKIPMEVGDVQSSPFIKVNLADKLSEKLLFDTGSDDFYSLCERNFTFFRKNAHIDTAIHRVGYGSSSISIYGMEKDTAKFQLKLPNFAIGTSKIQNVLTESTSDNNSRLGAKVLYYGKVVLDYPNKAFYFVPTQIKQVFRPEGDFGFFTGMKGNQLIVSGIWKDSDAQKAGLKPGFVMLAMDEFNLENLDFTQFCELFMNPPTRTRQQIRLTYLNEQGEKQTTILKRK